LSYRDAAVDSIWPARGGEIYMPGVRVLFASLLAAGSLATASPVATPAVNQTIVDESAGGVSASLNRLAGGIISYVRWPGMALNASRSACTIGQPTLTKSLRPVTPGKIPTITYWTATVASLAGGQPCDILYIGAMPTADHRQLMNWLRNRPVLTMTDNDAECLSGAAFCFRQRSGGLSFSMNIDAITRSKLSVDPRVLQLAQSGGRGT
jgi:YfiR/HmsC-like